MDILSPNERRKRMQAIRSIGTALENKVCSELWRRGCRFRRNVKGLYGKPDIAVKKRRLVVFIDSCYWHGCPEHCRLSSSNRAYWETKIQSNIKRDAQVTQYYIEQGWSIVRIWEHELKKDFPNVIDRLTALFRDKDCS